MQINIYDYKTNTHWGGNIIYIVYARGKLTRHTLLLRCIQFYEPPSHWVKLKYRCLIRLTVSAIEK